VSYLLNFVFDIFFEFCGTQLFVEQSDCSFFTPLVAGVGIPGVRTNYEEIPGLGTSHLLFVCYCVSVLFEQHGGNVVTKRKTHGRLSTVLSNTHTFGLNAKMRL